MPSTTTIKRRMATRAWRKAVRGAVSAAMIFALVFGIFARESLHEPPSADDLAAVEAILDHGHGHGDPGDLLRILHGHGPEAVDHDQKPILAAAQLPQTLRLPLGARWRSGSALMRSPPVFDLDRPPRA